MMEFSAKPRSGLRCRDGIALPAALAALVLLTLLATAASYSVREELLLSTSSSNAADALGLAERGLTDVVADWGPAVVAPLNVWDTVTVSDTVGRGVWSVEVKRLPSDLYLLASTGRVHPGGVGAPRATMSVGMLARLRSAEVRPTTAVITQGPTTISGTAEVRGNDLDPVVWPGICTGVLTNGPGIVTNDATQVTTSGSGTYSGTPALQEDVTVADSTFTSFGEVDWAGLVAMATKVIPGGTYASIMPAESGGVCTTNNAFNWGDPLNPTAACGGYFPIIHLTGDASLQGGGRGQGILLVDGDLDIRGGFSFYGIIITQGTFETQGSGNRVMGGVMARNLDFDDQTVTGGSIIQRSSCVMDRVVSQNPVLSSIRPLENRSWLDLSFLER